MTIICGESTADGISFFLAENKKAATFYGRVTDIICGSSDEVDEWGGWHIDMSIEDLEEEGYEFTEGTTIEQLVAAAIKSGAKPATVDNCKKLLVEDDPDYPDGGFEAGEVWGELFDE